MRVLVTGGLGFVGSHVVETLLAAGHEPIVLDIARDTSPPDGVQLVTADVRDPDAARSMLRGVDVVCHQAAKVGLGVDTGDLPSYASHNDVGTAVLLAAMAEAGVRRLVLASSMVVYGEGAYSCPVHGPVPPGPRRVEDLAASRFEPPCPICGGPLHAGLVYEDAPADPRNAYAVSKLAQEHYAAAWARAIDGSVTALRYHNVYGPRLPVDTPYAGVAALFRSALRRGEPPRVFEDGLQRRDFVHVRDVAQANLDAILAEPPNGLRAYNVGSGTPRGVGELAFALARALGGPQPIVTGEYRLGDVRHVTASSERIRAELGWSAEVKFETGIAELATEQGEADRS